MKKKRVYLKKMVKKNIVNANSAVKNETILKLKRLISIISVVNIIFLLIIGLVSATYGSFEVLALAMACIISNLTIFLIVKSRIHKLQFGGQI